MVKITDYKLLSDDSILGLEAQVIKKCIDGYIPSGSVVINYLNMSFQQDWRYSQPMIKIDQTVLTEEDGETLLNFLKPNN